MSGGAGGRAEDIGHDNDGAAANVQLELVQGGRRAGGRADGGVDAGGGAGRVVPQVHGGVQAVPAPRPEEPRRVPGVRRRGRPHRRHRARPPRQAAAVLRRHHDAAAREPRRQHRPPLGQAADPVRVRRRGARHRARLRQVPERGAADAGAGLAGAGRPSRLRHARLPQRAEGGHPRGVHRNHPGPQGRGRQLVHVPQDAGAARGGHSAVRLDGRQRPRPH